jgi:sugar fermentation stimulation protein A
MRFSPPLEEGRLIQRYKRFLADIETASGELLTIHCPNTGSMFNCMMPGGRVWFSRSNDPKRKLPGTWEITETPQGRLACVNTARANRLVEEALLAGVITDWQGLRRSSVKSPTVRKTAASTSVWITPMARCTWKSKA